MSTKRKDAKLSKIHFYYYESGQDYKCYVYHCATIWVLKPGQLCWKVFVENTNNTHETVKGNIDLYTELSRAILLIYPNSYENMAPFYKFETECGRSFKYSNLRSLNRFMKYSLLLVYLILFCFYFVLVCYSESSNSTPVYSSFGIFSSLVSSFPLVLFPVNLCTASSLLTSH